MSALPSPDVAAGGGTLLDSLRWLYPISGLLHVGAGDSLADLPCANWEVPQALLVEADEERCTSLAAALQGRAGWKAVNALVAAQAGPVDFHVASHPRESGLLDPQCLRSVWRNLHALEVRSSAAVSLPSLIAAQAATQPVNWAFIDCLPALPLLQGLATWGDTLDVLVVRALLVPGLVATPGADAASIGALLQTRSFHQVAVLPEVHPALGQLVFVRDWRALQVTRIHTLESALQGDRAAKEDALRQVHALQVQADEKALLHASTLASVREQLREMQIGQDARLAALQAQKDSLAATLAASQAAMTVQQTELAARAEAIAACETTISSQLALMAEHAGHVDESAARIAVLDTELAQVRAQAAELQTRCTALAQQVRERDQQLADAAAQAARWTEDGVLREQAHELLVASASQRELDLQAAQQAVASGQAQQGQLQAALDSARLALEQQALAHEQQTLAHEALQLRMHQTEGLLAGERERRAGDALAQEQQLAELVEQRRQTMYWKQSQEATKLHADDLEQQLAALGQRIEEQERFLAERQQQLARLMRDHDEHARVSAERLQHIEGLTRTSEAQAGRLAQLERERVELDARQRLLDQEIVKAEAQIELIKDVVLREKAF